MSRRPIKVVPVDTSCCAGYKEFTFYGNTFPGDYTIYNSTASNYIHGEVDTSGLQTLRVIFPSLTAYTLDIKSVQVIATTVLSTSVIVGYNSDNTVDISWDDLGVIEGVFTVRIWTDHLTEAVLS